VVALHAAGDRVQRVVRLASKPRTALGIYFNPPRGPACGKRFDSGVGHRTRSGTLRPNRWTLLRKHPPSTALRARASTRESPASNGTKETLLVHRGIQEPFNPKFGSTSIGLPITGCT
jgi:hypothetical protein